jgi:ABC-type multidrug transport system fused ATPase/permease subunit
MEDKNKVKEKDDSPENLSPDVSQITQATTTTDTNLNNSPKNLFYTILFKTSIFVILCITIFYSISLFGFTIPLIITVIVIAGFSIWIIPKFQIKRLKKYRQLKMKQILSVKKSA